MQLLAELAPVRSLLPAAPQLQEAAYRLSARWDKARLWQGAGLSACLGIVLTVVVLVSHTPPAPAPPAAACRFLCLSGKSQSPVVARLHAARDTGRLSPRDGRTSLRWVGGRVAG